MPLKFASTVLRDFLDLVFPTSCPGCGNQIQKSEGIICLNCEHNLPVTGSLYTYSSLMTEAINEYAQVGEALAYLYFVKGGLGQKIVHKIKYNKGKELGVAMGQRIGSALISENLAIEFDFLVAIPLHKAREKERGFNQSLSLCEGISLATGIPILKNNLIRTVKTTTQTRKTRLQRWENVKDAFEFEHVETIQNFRLLVVDDVFTTGATLGSCAKLALESGAKKVSVITLAYAGL